MKHCTNCGAEIADDAKFCTWCGTAVAAADPVPAAYAAPAPAPYAAPTLTSSPEPVQPAQPTQTTTPYTTYAQPTYPSAAPASAAAAAGKMDGLAIATIVFLGISALANIVNLFGYMNSDSGTAILYGIMGLLSIMFIVILVPKLKSGQPISTALKVLTLLFGSLISGILLFVRKDNQR